MTESVTPTAAPAVSGAKTNVLAIVALVAAFFVPIVGIICGHIALGQIKKTGENGRGLALAGTVLGYVFTALWLIVILAWGALVAALAGAGMYY